ncbi:PucR family transcriptional regulator [Bacillus benzoevorans]|uniref:Purine catabolism regulator n=2 Tax=Bacillus benzoevorans TaxID=1456 RepID=A0A7X0LWL1_9BACI|nr:purine catabolism regulator [Bacillus benzoevorans]
MEILENLAIELELSVSIIDFLEDKNFHYPKQEQTVELEKTLRSLLDPPFDHQAEMIDDKINIYRIRSLEEQEQNSWVMIPIKVNHILAGKIVVWEKGKELGYFDLLALRVTLAILVYTFGQIYYMNSKEAHFHDDFIREILLEESDKEKLLKNAKNLSWDVRNKYVCISFKQINNQIQLEDHRDLIGAITGRFFPKKETPLGLLDGVIIIFQPADETTSQLNNEELAKKCSKLIAALEKEIPNAIIMGGIGRSIDAFYRIKKSYNESMKTLEIGHLLYPDRKLHFYKDLGPFGLFNLEAFKEEVGHVFESISPVLQQEDKDELINTLKIYLESKCNYNLAAKRLYIHHNTVRYRIAKIQQLCQLDLEDSIERLKLEIILKLEKHLDE